MTGLVMVALLLIVLCALALCLPLWRANLPQGGLTRSELNRRLYQRRLVEIEQEREVGVLGDEQETLVELQRSLLDDVPGAETPASAGARWVWLPGVLALVVISVGLYWHLGGWREVMAWQSASSRLSELSNRILVERDSQVTEQDLQDFTLALRTRLQSDGQDYRGWLLLGRLLLDSNDGESAEQALDRAYRLSPDPDLVAVPYAQALMTNGDEARARELLGKVLAHNPSNLEARSLTAFMALQKEDYQGALAEWQSMLPLLEAGSARYQMIERSMNYARQQLAERAPVVHGASAGQSAASAASGFPLTVTLSEGVTLPEHSYLFVYAVEPDGPPMPIAVQRIESPRFPVSLRLTDADAMMEGGKLADHPKLQFRARISASGNVMDRSGAWEGASQPVDLQAPMPVSIDIRIDHPL